MGILSNLVNWTQATFLPYGGLGLFVLAFVESSFFPVPPDILLILLSLMNPDKALLYAAICTIGSVLGAAFGYFIGLKGGLPLVKKVVSEQKIDVAHNFYNRYEAWAIFIAGFTPLPFKLFTITGGIFYINFKKFLIAAFASRGLRFFAEGLLLMFFGAWITDFIKEYFSIAVIAVVLITITGYALLVLIAKRIGEKEKV